MGTIQGPVPRASSLPGTVLDTLSQLRNLTLTTQETDTVSPILKMRGIGAQETNYLMSSRAMIGMDSDLPDSKTMFFQLYRGRGKPIRELAPRCLP